MPDRLFLAQVGGLSIADMTDLLTTTHTTTSADGTPIGFSWGGAGTGPPVLLIDAALCHRGSGPNRKLAARLARDVPVVTYDRRGRGESGDTCRYAVQREVEDVAAVIGAIGGLAYLYGISSGGALALVAARSLPDMVAGLAVYEIPFVVDGSRPPVGSDLGDRLHRLVAAGERGRAVRLFMREAVGLPRLLVAGMPLFPGWAANKALAHTLPYDVALMGDGQQGRPVPGHRWRDIVAPVLVASGGRSPAWVRNAAVQLAGVLPGAEHQELPGERHYVKPDAMAQVLQTFITHTNQEALR